MDLLLLFLLSLLFRCSVVSVPAQAQEVTPTVSLETRARWGGGLPSVPERGKEEQWGPPGLGSNSPDSEWEQSP